MNYVISVDWFQYFCKWKYRADLQTGTFFVGKTKNKQGYLSNYEVCEGEEFNPIYRRAATIKLHKFSLIHIFWKPKMEQIDKNNLAIKVDNRLLYTCDWSFYLHDIIAALNIEVKSITRIDLAADFTHFHNELRPNDFIRNYFNDGISSKVETYIREGNNKYVVMGTKTYNVGVPEEDMPDLGCITSTYNCHDYLRFGTRNSGCSVYLYNKERELREKTDKPWIRDMWEKAGIGGGADPVYRLELCVKEKGMSYKTIDGEWHPAFKPAEIKAGCIEAKAKDIYKLQFDDIATQELLERVFWSYALKYFSFRIVDGHKYKKDMKRLQLFDPEIRPYIKPSQICKKLDAGVAERNAAACIQRIANNVWGLDSGDLETLERAESLLRRIGISKEYRHSDEMYYYDTTDMAKLSSAKARRQRQKAIRAELAKILPLTLCNGSTIQPDVIDTILDVYPALKDPRVQEAIEIYELECLGVDPDFQKEMAEAAKMSIEMSNQIYATYESIYQQDITARSPLP